MKKLSLFELKNCTRAIVDRYFIDNNYKIYKVDFIESTMSQVITYKLQSIIDDKITCIFNRDSKLTMIELN